MIANASKSFLQRNMPFSLADWSKPIAEAACRL
jgi:hypothetical protein